MGIPIRLRVMMLCSMLIPFLSAPMSAVSVPFDCYQLVKKTTSPTDHEYVTFTYFYQYEVQYDLTLDAADGSVLTAIPLTSDYDYDTGYFTDKTLVVAKLPSAFCNADAAGKSLTEFKICRMYGTPQTIDEQDCLSEATGHLADADHCYFALFNNQDDWTTAPGFDQAKSQARYYLQINGTFQDDLGTEFIETTSSASKTMKLSFPNWTVADIDADITSFETPAPSATFHPTTGYGTSGPQDCLITVNDVVENDLTVTAKLNPIKAYPPQLQKAVVETEDFKPYLSVNSKQIEIHPLYYPGYDTYTYVTLRGADPTIEGLDIDPINNGAVYHIGNSLLSGPRYWDVIDGTDIYTKHFTSTYHKSEGLSPEKFFTLWTDKGENEFYEQLYANALELSFMNEETFKGVVLSNDAERQVVGLYEYPSWSFLDKTFRLCDLNNATAPVLLQEWGPTTWWDGMYEFTNINKANSLYFVTQHLFRLGSGLPEYSSTPPEPTTQAMLSRRAQRYGSSPLSPSATHVAHGGSYHFLHFSSGVLTSVQAKPQQGKSFAVGQGCIDIADASLKVVNIQGHVVATGEGRHELPAGVYIVAAPAGAIKVIVP